MKKATNIWKLLPLSFLLGIVSCAKEGAVENGQSALDIQGAGVEKWEVVFTDKHTWVIGKLVEPEAKTTKQLLAFDFGDQYVPEELPHSIARVEILEDGARVKLWEEPSGSSTHELSTKGNSSSNTTGWFSEVVGISNLGSSGWDLIQSSQNGFSRLSLTSTPFIQMKACPSGGSGSSSCSSSSGGWSCSVSCGSGYYSCCSHGVSCWCIKNGVPEPK